MTLPKILLKNLLVKKIEKEAKKTTLIMVEQREPEHMECIVEAIGCDVKHVCVGDKVLIPTYSGGTIILDDIKYKLVTEEMVLVVWSKE